MNYTSIQIPFPNLIDIDALAIVECFGSPLSLHKGAVVPNELAPSLINEWAVEFTGRSNDICKQLLVHKCFDCDGGLKLVRSLTTGELPRCEV